jgi:hypothetical protein
MRQNECHSEVAALCQLTIVDEVVTIFNVSGRSRLQRWTHLAQPSLRTPYTNV